MSIVNLLAVVGVSLLFGLLLIMNVNTIYSYFKREELGPEIYFPTNTVYLHPKSSRTLRTTNHKSYRVGIYISIITCFFIIGLWITFLFLDKSVWRLFGLICWQYLFFANTFEIRKKGLIYNGNLIKWEEIESYEWGGKENKRLLIMKLRKRKPFLRSIYFEPFSEESFMKIDQLLKNQESGTLTCN